MFDSPGECDDFEIIAVEALKFFASMDRIFILYEGSLRASKIIVTVLNKINPNGTYLVRTKCDNWDKSHTRTIDEELAKDQAFTR